MVRSKRRCAKIRDLSTSTNWAVHTRSARVSGPSELCQLDFPGRANMFCSKFQAGLTWFARSSRVIDDLVVDVL